MLLKYTSRWKVMTYIVMTTIKATQAIFIAYIFKLLINFAENPKGNLIVLITTAVVGLISYAIFNIFFQYLYASIIADININVKQTITNYLVRVRHKKITIDSSFMTNDLKQLETNRIEAELAILDNGIQFLAAVIAGFVASWFISLIFIVTSFAPAIIQGIFGKKIEERFGEWQKENSSYTNTVQETISSVHLANLYNVENSIIGRLTKNIKQVEHALLKANWTKGTANEIITATAFIFGLIIPFGFGVFLISLGSLSLGTFMMITQLSNYFVNPIVEVFESINSIKTTNPIWEKFQETVTTENPNIELTQQPKDVFNELKLDDIGVSINGNQILKHVNLEIYHGNKVLLEAPSGWGKSTLLNLLTGNYKANIGTYKINGKSVNGKWEEIHQYFSFIQQDPLILDDTLKYNIVLDRNVSEEELQTVVNHVGLKELVNNKGWDYKVGPNGKNLSGGQNQRIEIARALISKRPILLADEATSSLDKELTKQIHQTILENFSGTVIEVAHHVSQEDKSNFNRVINLAENQI